MKTFLRLSVSVVGVLLSVAAASASEKINVTTSRALRIAGVYDVDQMTSWTAVQHVFATSVSATLTRPSERPLPVQMVETSKATIAEELLTGKYDAALVVADTLPAALVGPRFASIRTVPESNGSQRVFHLVMRNEDPGLLRAMAEAFYQATSSASFRNTVEHAMSTPILADVRTLRLSR